MKFAVVLEDVVQVPASSDSPPRARINFLFHAGDGSHRLFVNDMTGKIYVIRDGHVLPQPFLDMAIARKGSFTSTDLFEQGLNTFAFHPDFARGSRPGSGKLYTFSTETPQSGIADFPTPDAAGGVDHHDVVAEWSIDPANPNRIDPSSRREILRIAHPLHDHVGGQLGFNPNAKPGQSEYGLLYIGVGDGGNTIFRTGKVDAWRTAQNLLSPLGKILRINPLQDGRWKYGVPPGKAGKYFFGDIASGRVFFTNVDQLANGKAAPFFELPLIYSGKQQSLREIMHADRADLRFGQDELGEIYLLTKQDGVIRKLARSVETESTILPVDHPVGSLNK